MSLPLPADLTLPLFVYGVFKPGELCHHRVRPFLAEPPVNDRVPGALYVRDGLPLVILGDAQNGASGFVLTFSSEKSSDAYQQISDFEPRAQYRWDTVQTLDRNLKVNVLVARSPSKGHPEPFEEGSWSHLHDPVFREGLNLVGEVLRKSGKKPFQSAPPHAFEWDRFFRLQMAYLLLWAAVERYTALAFGPNVDPNDRVKKLGASPEFQRAVAVAVSRTGIVSDSRDPSTTYRIDRNTPDEAALYYYQIRSNLSHRGKGAWNDGELVRTSLCELLKIFRSVLGT
jgi:gamma-glutamylcyclotransferase (GGCT)/AIG2-like uncharacterized protein YtfP